MYWINFFIIIIIATASLFGTVYIFRYKWNGEHKLKRITQNVAVSVFSILIIVLILELFFSFFAQSDSLGYTLASRNWFKRYWIKNSLGYRDIEWTPELLEGRTKVMVLGDSFAAGWGIDRMEDLFSHKLGQRLGENYAVMNVGRAGANTKAEIKNALNYPYEPDIVVLAFYLNDIEGVAVEKGLPPIAAKQIEVPTIIEPVIENSYAANFLYWRLYRLRADDNRSERSWAWLKSRYHDPDVWKDYEEILLSIDTYLKVREKELIVVVFPNLRAVEESRPMTSKVVDLYTQQGLTVLDVTDLVIDTNWRQLVVNPVDPHPSQYVHELVANALYPIVLASEKSQSMQRERETSTQSD